MTRRSAALDFGTRLLVDRIPPPGRTVSVAADEEQLLRLAERFRVDAVTAFSAEVTAKRFRGGVRVKGEVRGGVVQSCVVTGEPVAQEITEPVDRTFLPGRDEAAEAPAGAEVFVNLGEEDLPDWFEGNEIDLDEMLMEIFALAIDLYPRAPGAGLPEGGAGDDPAELSPFAVLKGLKKNE